jgi:exodeoxyribonuclease VII small subunit
MSTEPSFEEAQRELEQIVQRLESGQAGVEEAIDLAERGEQLYRLCAGKLEAAEGRVDELSRRPEAG